MKCLRYSLFITFFFALASSCKFNKTENRQPSPELYTCSMHPQIIRTQPGDCPICGMHLVKKESSSNAIDSLQLDAVLMPTNSVVLSSVPVTNIQFKKQEINVEALGAVYYDVNEIENIAAKTSGRIEKLYVHYRFQKITKGQKIMDIYSPEILTAEQNLIYLLENDEYNHALIEAARNRLSYLGMDASQLNDLIKFKKPFNTISVFSNYTGHIHEAGNTSMNNTPGNMKDIATLTEELPLKEGMYVQKSQTIFKVFNPDKVWAILNIYGEHQSLIKVGNPVSFTAETQPDKIIDATINFIEPFLRKENKTITARISFNNTRLQIPVGSQVKANIKTILPAAYWLPKSAVVSLGINQVVFLRIENIFKAHKVETGLSNNNEIQIVHGLTPQDTVAANAQYLIDSESFIKTKE
jgi:Cu(I)/Ag(I) efflux system membrane fusion protein